MKKILWFIVFSTIFSPIFGNENCMIAGKVYNENGDELPYATIQLLSTNNLIHKGFYSDHTGCFCLSNIDKGEYKIKIASLGSDIYVSNPFDLTTESNIDLGKITLYHFSNNLTEVAIIGNNYKRLSGSGEYISPIKIAQLNQADVNKVLRTIPGINIREEEGFGLRPNIGLRGTPVNRSAKITLMEDGILMAPAPYADPSAYYFPTFMRMHGIEVLKGSSQIKHGPYTIGGALNLISTPIPNTFKGLIEGSYGSFGTNQQRVWIGDSKQNFDYLFEVNRFASNGFKELDNGGNTGFDRKDMMVKLRWHTHQNASVYQSVSLKLLHMEEIGNETYLGLSYKDYIANPMRRYAATQNDMLDMNHQHIILQHTIIPVNKLTIQTSAYYNNTFRDWARVNSIAGQNINNILASPDDYLQEYGIMTGKIDGNIQYRSAARNYFAKGLQTNIQYQFVTQSLEHKLQLGLRYHQDQADRWATNSIYTMSNSKMILSNAGINGNHENQVRNAKSFSGFINYDLHYKGFTLIPGIRYENITLGLVDFGKNDVARIGTEKKEASNEIIAILPGLSFNYEILKNISTFGGIHKGFSPPGMPSLTANSNQARNETAINYELGYRMATKTFNTQIVGFISEYANLLSSDNLSGGGSGTGEMFNAGKAHIQGIEWSANYIMLNHNKYRIPLQIAYTFTDARFSETFVNGGGDWGSGQINKGDAIPFITPHMLTGSIGIEKANFDVTLTGRYVGITRTKPSQGNYVLPNDASNYNDVNAIDQHLIVDASANYKVSKSFTTFAKLSNITNNKTIIANLPQGYRPTMPFSVMFGVKYAL